MTLPWILTEIALLVGFVLAVVLVAHIIRKKGSPPVTIAWLMVIVTLPYVGVPLYLVFGGRKIRRRARKKRGLGLREYEARPVADAGRIDRLLRAYDIPGATTGNRFELCPTGEDGYARLVELIDGATTSIHVAMYILQPDEVGTDIVARLARRAADGVDVRVLLDDVGSHGTSWRFLAPLTEAGGHAAFFMPVWDSPLRGRRNLRNHRKLVVADGRRVMAGGTNIATEYIGPTPKPDRWCDLSFVLEGPAAVHYADVFRSDWEFASDEPFPDDDEEPPVVPSATGNAVVQVVPSGPDVPGDPLYDAIVSAAFAAKRRFWVATPYFVPDDALTQALVLAARRGVDVRALVPERADMWLLHLASGPYLRLVQAAGGTVLRYTGSMMHAKVALLDSDLAIIGSANMDMRSLFLNYEVAAFVYSAAEIRATTAWLEELAAQSRSGVEQVGTVRDFAEGLVKLMAPLL